MLAESLTINLGNLCGGTSGVSTKDVFRLLKEELREVLVLKLAFLNIMGNWQVIDPVLSNRAQFGARLDVFSLELDNLAN